jgi:hypothetical protein
MSTTRTQTLRGRSSCVGIVLLAAAGPLGCQTAPSSLPEAAQQVLCPELSSGVDLLQLSYSDDPAANGRIRAFVSAVRGLYDVSIEMERQAADACRRMSHDLGYPPMPADAPLDKLCEPIKTTVAGLTAAGIEIRISIAPPHCDVDADRGQRCGSTCASAAGNAGECTLLCKAQADLYARCTLPSVTVAASIGGQNVERLAHTIEDNFPSLLYAEIALGRRLVDNVETLVTTSTRLPNDVKSAGEHGVACAALAAVLTAKAAGRLHSVLTTCASTTATLNPEIHASNGVAR